MSSENEWNFFSKVAFFSLGSVVFYSKKIHLPSQPWCVTPKMIFKLAGENDGNKTWSIVEPERFCRNNLKRIFKQWGRACKIYYMKKAERLITDLTSLLTTCHHNAHQWNNKNREINCHSQNREYAFKIFTTLLAFNCTN